MYGSDTPNCSVIDRRLPRVAAAAAKPPNLAPRTRCELARIELPVELRVDVGCQPRVKARQRSPMRSRSDRASRADGRRSEPSPADPRLCAAAQAAAHAGGASRNVLEQLERRREIA